jgi:hypothetical protein
MNVHLDWQGEPHLVGRLFTAEKSVTFEYAPEWIKRAFAIDPTSLIDQQLRRSSAQPCLSHGSGGSLVVVSGL